MKEPTLTLQQRVLDEVRKHNLWEHLLTVPLVLGVSGGADSLAMLHLLAALRGEDAAATLHVAHLNHWVRGKEARDDAQFVRSIALDWGLTYTIGEFDVPNYARTHKLSVEDAARRARYAFFASLAQQQGAAVAVAHNADDQVETVLMSILRGTGLRGLAGMQMLSSVHLPAPDEALARFGPYSHTKEVALFRPLLGVWRWQILDYCKEADLEPRWDSTNWEPQYRRNRVRHDLIPMLQMQYSLAIKEHLFNLSMIAQGDDQWLTQETSELLAQITTTEKQTGEIAFTTETFAALDRGMQRRLVRAAIAKIAGTERDLTFKQIEAAAALLAGEEGSPNAMHMPHGVEVGRSQLQSYVKLREQDHLVTEFSPDRPLVERQWQAQFETQTEFEIAGGWRFASTLLTTRNDLPDSIEDPDFAAVFDRDALQEFGPLVWRARQQGDYLKPMGMRGRKTLQDIMVDAKIPRGQRDHIPLLAVENTHEILWIPGKGGRRSMHAPVSELSSGIVAMQWQRMDDRR